MTYKEIYEGLQKEANMKKEATMKLARMIKKAKINKKALNDSQVLQYIHSLLPKLKSPISADTVKSLNSIGLKLKHPGYTVIAPSTNEAISETSKEELKNVMKRLQDYGNNQSWKKYFSLNPTKWQPGTARVFDGAFSDEAIQNGVVNGLLQR